MFSQITTDGVATWDDFSFGGCHLVPYPNNQPIRQHQLENVLLAHYANKAVIFGDFTIDRWKDNGDPNIPTWDGSFFKDGCEKKARFDRVLSRGVVVSDYIVHSDILLSDHFPVSFKISI